MDLKDIMARLGRPSDPKLLIGFESADDASVYLLREDLAIVQTADFITPIVDSPFEFGQIAAANAMSDVYAKGGKPLTALNICCFPDRDMPHEELREILEGGFSKIREAGALLVGGHTVRDRELKYGLAVTGTVHPKDVKPNSSARPGDAIVLTKPIGTGILTSAAKSDVISAEALKPALESMCRLNDTAAKWMVDLGAHAATDITGFGLAGHLSHVVRASRVSVVIRYADVPVFPRVRELSRQGVKTGMAFSNEQYCHDLLRFGDSISREDQLVCLDPQTSGGLAIFIPEERAEELLRRLKGEGLDAALIGAVEPGAPALLIEGHTT